MIICNLCKNELKVIVKTETEYKDCRACNLGVFSSSCSCQIITKEGSNVEQKKNGEGMNGDRLNLIKNKPGQTDRNHVKIPGWRDSKPDKMQEVRDPGSELKQDPV